VVEDDRSAVGLPRPAPTGQDASFFLVGKMGGAKGLDCATSSHIEVMKAKLRPGWCLPLFLLIGKNGSSSKIGSRGWVECVHVYLQQSNSAPRSTF
jgi:hypothetical protein